MESQKGMCNDDTDPFKDLKIEDWMILDEVCERQPCVVCKKSRKYFCYNCCIPVQDLQGQVPKVKVRVVLCCVIARFLSKNCSFMWNEECTVLFYCSCLLRSTSLSIHGKSTGRVLQYMQQFWHLMMSISIPIHVYQIMDQMRR